jgi:alkylhydroperoxidase family enzyme
LAPQELPEDDYAHVADWATWPGYSDAERIALEYAEKFALDHVELDDAFFARMHDHFTDEEIMEIAVSVGCWLMMGRITMVMGVNVSCPVRLDLGAGAGAAPA